MRLWAAWRTWSPPKSWAPTARPAARGARHPGLLPAAEAAAAAPAGGCSARCTCRSGRRRTASCRAAMATWRAAAAAARRRAPPTAPSHPSTSPGGLGATATRQRTTRNDGWWLVVGNWELAVGKASGQTVVRPAARCPPTPRAVLKGCCRGLLPSVKDVSTRARVWSDYAMGPNGAFNPNPNP